MTTNKSSQEIELKETILKKSNQINYLTYTILLLISIAYLFIIYIYKQHPEELQDSHFATKVNYYQVLKVGQRATQKEIENAYIQRIKEKNRDFPLRAYRLAFKILSDEKNRNYYDNHRYRGDEIESFR
jgi:hypothetical protein